MSADVIAHYTGYSVQEIERLLSLGVDHIFNDGNYVDMVNDLDRELLYNTLPAARDAYDKGLPGFKANLSDRYDFTDSPMSAFTLANWLVSFLEQPDQLPTLLDQHAKVPLDILTDGLPDLLAILDNVGNSRAEWQKALAVIGQSHMLS